MHNTFGYCSPDDPKVIDGFDREKCVDHEYHSGQLYEKNGSAGSCMEYVVNMLLIARSMPLMMISEMHDSRHSRLQFSGLVRRGIDTVYDAATLCWIVRFASVVLDTLGSSGAVPHLYLILTLTG